MTPAQALPPGGAAWSLRRRLARASLVLGTLLAALFIAAGLILAQMVATQREVTDELFDAVIHSATMFRSVVDQQTGLRGYELTADPEFLSPYSDGVALEQESYAQLQAIYADDPQLREAADRTHAAAARWRETIAEPRIAQIRALPAGVRPDLTFAELEGGKAAFDEVRADYTAYRTSLLDRRREEADRLRAETVLLVGVFLLSALAVALAALALWRALRRWVTRPLGQLGAEVRQVRSGDLDHEVSVTGPREITSVAADVDAMRRRIVREYERAHAARTEAEEAQQQVEEQARELRRSNQELEQFAYVASHDLQEPLRKVASFCQLLERRYRGQLDERADQYIAFAVDGAKRMQVLINDLLAFSRVGRTAGPTTEVELDACLAQALRVLEARIEETGAQVSADPLPVVRGEASLLTQLFQNLVGNALKFRREEQAPRVHIGVRAGSEEHEFSCADNGIGIEPQYAEKIFVIFQRLHGKEEYGGTGIGLALCRKIVEYHGGRIWLDTSAEGGTTFRWTLPRVQVTVDPAEADSETTGVAA